MGRLRRTKTKYIAKRNKLVFDTNGERMKAERWPPADWDHWKAFGMKPTLDREAVKAHYSVAYHKQPTGKVREFEIAYGRVLSELWRKGVYPEGYTPKGEE